MPQRQMSSGCERNGKSSWPRPMPSALTKSPGQCESPAGLTTLLCNIQAASLHPQSSLGFSLLLHQGRPRLHSKQTRGWETVESDLKDASRKHKVDTNLAMVPLEPFTAAGSLCPGQSACSCNGCMLHVHCFFQSASCILLGCRGGLLMLRLRANSCTWGCLLWVVIGEKLADGLDVSLLSLSHQPGKSVFIYGSVNFQGNLGLALQFHRAYGPHRCCWPAMC